MPIRLTNIFVSSLICGWLLASAAYPQEVINEISETFNDKLESQGRFRFSLITERGHYNQGISQSYGLQAEIFITRWLSLGYHFGLGSNSQPETTSYGHLTLGAYGASFVFRDYLQRKNRSDSEFYLYATLLAFLLPESFNFHFRVGNNFFISPFIAPFGMEYNRVNNRDDWRPTFTGGLRFNIVKGVFTLGPYLAVRQNYGASQWGLLGGVSLGISI